MNRSARSYFAFILRSYVAVMIVQIVAFLFVYGRSIDSAEVGATRWIRLALARGRDLVDARLEEIEDAAQSTLSDPDILEFTRIGTPLQPVDYYRLWRLRTKFERYNLKSTFVDAVYLVFRRSGAVISNTYAIADMAWFYRHFLTYGELSYDEWSRRIGLWSSETSFFPVTDIGNQDGRERSVTVRIPLAVEATKPLAVLLVLIPEPRLASYFGPLVDAGGSVRVTGSNGETLLEYGGRRARREDQERKTLIVELPSSVNDLAFAARVPRAYVTSQVRPLRVMFLSALAISTIVYLSLSVYLASRQSRLYSRITRIIATGLGIDPSQIRFGGARFQQSIQRIKGEPVDVERALERRREIMFDGLYERLLHGGFATEEEAEEYTREMGLEFSAAPRFVAILSVTADDRTQDGHVVDALVHDYLRTRKPADWHVHRAKEGEVLICPDHPSHVATAVEMQEELWVSSHLPSTLAAGAPRRSLVDVQDSFVEARSALRTARAVRTGHAAVWFRGPRDVKYEFAAQDERTLVSYALAGNLEECRSLLRSIRTRNFDDRELSTLAAESLLSSIAAAVTKIMRDVSASPDELGLPVGFLRRLTRFESLDDFFDQAELGISAVCRFQERKRRSHNTELIDRIVDYVRLNRTDPLLCVASVAQAFSLNENYLSRFFKEQTAQTFSSFLEQARMDEAVASMTESNTTLRNIATSVGYQSWNSFYKAFRRHFGVSPGTYRAARRRTYEEKPDGSSG